MSGRCEWCVAEYGETGRPEHFGSDPSCALSGGTFDPNNWNCAGLHLLREDAYEVEVWNEDQHCAVLRTSTCAFIVLSYYKHRGRTEGAWVVDGTEVRPLTAKDVREYIDYRPPDSMEEHDEG